MKQLFYRPTEGYVGDVIPYYEDGVYYLYFLYAHRNPDKYGEGTSWYLVTTTDFVNYREYGEVLPHGSREEQDLNAFTGSIYKENGIYYLFYTGYNAHEPFLAQEEPLQAVMTARSDNLFHWKKLPEKTFYASEKFYELSDWRDPFVFYDEGKKEYGMLLAARLREGPKRRRGCVGMCRSADLENWTAVKPFFSPGLYMTHECPEVFRMGEWWYLLYSSFSERFATHYRMGRSLEGAFSSPAEDTFDGRAFYAGKTASDGEHRYLFGWVASKASKNDYGAYEWAGNLLVHELVQMADGTLSTILPRSVKDVFTEEIPFRIEGRMAGCQVNEREGSALYADAPDSFAAAVTDSDLPVRCLITTRIRFGKNTRAFGFLLRADAEFDTGYYIRLEPIWNRMVFDMWPRKIKKKEEDTWEINGDRPFFPELERSCPLQEDKEYEVEIVIDDTVCCVYFDGCTAMSTRLYNLKRGRLGFFASEGSARFNDIHIRIPQQTRREEGK